MKKSLRFYQNVKQTSVFMLLSIKTEEVYL